MNQHMIFIFGISNFLDFFHQGIHMFPCTKSLVVTEISMFLEYEYEAVIETKI